MSKSTFIPFSMMGNDEKAKIDLVIEESLKMMAEIADAPMAAKENLMKTNFKVASTQLNFIGRVLQSESATLQAVTVMADRASKSDKFTKILSSNLPQIKLPAQIAEKTETKA